MRSLGAASLALALIHLMDAGGAAPVSPSLLYEFVSVNYTFPNATFYNNAIADKSYQVENNIITGIKFDAAGNCYVTVPRWRTGVPSTLNKVVLDASGKPILQPFPSWEWNSISDPSALKYLQSMEVDPQQVMWMLDVGRLYIYDPVVQPDNSHPPKLVLYDLLQNTTIQTFIFPNEVAPWTSSFLNDLVLDVTNGYAYISDAGGPGGIIVYSRSTNTARRFSDQSTGFNPHVVITVNGVIYPGISTPVDGIALNPSTKRLYYCALRGDTLYSLPTSALQDFSLTNAQLSALVNNHGYKPPSDGMTFAWLASASVATLYFGDLNGNAVWSWNEGAPISSQGLVTPVDDVTEQWQDTFAFAGPGMLAYTTNRLQLYIAQTMVFTGTDANMRIFTVPIPGYVSYMDAQQPYNPSNGNNGNGNGNNVDSKTTVAVLSVFLVISLLALLAVIIIYGRASGWRCCFAIRDVKGRPGSGLKAADAMIVEDAFY
jgi:Major royal jelly protein